MFLLLAQDRIPRRNAVALGYIAQLLLQTLPGVRDEMTRCLGHAAWDETLDSVFSEDDDLENHANNDETGLSANSGPEEEPEDENDREDSVNDAEAAARPDHRPDSGLPVDAETLGAPISVLAADRAPAEPTETEPARTDRVSPPAVWAIPEWSPSLYGRLHRKQRRLLIAGFECPQRCVSSEPKAEDSPDPEQSTVQQPATELDATQVK